ncbi:MAG: hypothetical protein Q8R18_04570 [bacterium]|nr:hypothetical protein [bacterium]
MAEIIDLHAIQSFQELFLYAEKIVKYSRDYGKTWRYAKLSPSPEHFSKGAFGFATSEKISPNGVHA